MIDFLDNKFKTFACVAQNMSFTKASQILFVSQPAVTQQIKSLEKQLNVQLFYRELNGLIRLTPQGALLYDYLEKISDNFSDFESEFFKIEKQSSGIIKLGASTTIAQYVIAEIISSYSKFNNKIYITVANSHEITEKLIHGDIDLGIIEDDLSNDKINHKLFQFDEIVLVYSKNDKYFTEQLERFRNLKSLNFKQFIYKIPIILREEQSGTRRVILDRLVKNNINVKKLNIILETNSTELIKSLVENSYGAAFISKFAIKNELKLKSLQIFDLPDFKINREFKFIYSKNLATKKSRLVNDFIDYATNYINK